VKLEDMGEILSRLDERTKHIKEKLDDHIDLNPCETCVIQPRIATIETNLKWIKRISASLLGITGVVTGLWKGLN
jgi:hypothetical protein